MDCISVLYIACCNVQLVYIFLILCRIIQIECMVSSCIFRNLFCINGGVPLASTPQRRFLFRNRISTKRTAYLSYILLLFSSPLPFSMFISYNMFWADRIEYRASLFIWPRRKPAVKIHLLMNKCHVSRKNLNGRKHFLNRKQRAQGHHIFHLYKC